MSGAFQGNYTADLFNASKRYYMQFQKGVPLADSECREIGLASSQFLRQLIHNNFPRGSSTNNGFKVVESASPSNNFTIKGGDGTVNGSGVLFVDGYILFLKGDIEYIYQDDTGAITDDDYTKTLIPALTTPGGARTDEVYVDFYFAESSANPGSEYLDSGLTVAGVGTNTANRLRQVQDIRVVEGGVTPADYTDGNGIFHRCVKIATINRTASANITNAMITDNRILINPVSSLALFTPEQVLYGDSDGSFAQNSGFVYKSGTVRVGIGTTIPLDTLHVEGNIVGKLTASPSNIGSTTRRIGTIYMASTIDYLAGGLNFSDPGGVKVTILNGNLGIGSTIPTKAVDVVGELRTTGKVTVGNNLEVNGTTTTINTETTTTDMMEIAQDDNQTALKVRQTTAGNNARVVEVENSGTGAAISVIGIGTGTPYVGIGTTNPEGIVHFKHPTSAADIYLEGTGGNKGKWILSSSDYGGQKTFKISNTTIALLSIFNDGKTGIGTTIPLNMLDVYQPGGTTLPFATASVRSPTNVVLGLARDDARAVVLAITHGTGFNNWASQIVQGDSLIQSSAGQNFHIGSNSQTSPTITFTPGGKIGIGTIPVGGDPVLHTYRANAPIHHTLSSGNADNNAAFLINFDDGTGLATVARFSVSRSSGVFTTLLGTESGQGQVKIQADGNAVITINGYSSTDADGNIGINVAPHQYRKVNVYSNIDDHSIIYAVHEPTTPGTGGAAIYGRSNDSVGRAIQGDSTSGYSGYFSGKLFHVLAETSFIGLGTTSGNRVGIGTTDPQAMLHIRRPTFTPLPYQRALLIDSCMQSGYDPFRIRSADDDANTIFIVKNTSQVGIGTTDPQGTLHAEGSIVGGLTANLPDLGASDRRWANLYMASTIDFSSDLNFNSSGTKVIFKTDGKVGIGTSDPITLAHICSDSAAALLSIDGAAGNLSALQLRRGSSTLDARFQSSSSEVQIGSVGALDLNIITGGASKILVKNSNGYVGIGTTTVLKQLHVAGDGIFVNPITYSRVGIGTTNPVSSFHVYDSSSNSTVYVEAGTAAQAQIYLRRNGANDAVFQSSSASGVEIGSIAALDVKILTGGLTKVFIRNSDGKVGIGTTNPVGNLHIRAAAASSAILNVDSGDTGTAATVQLRRVGSLDAIFSSSSSGVQVGSSTTIPTKIISNATEAITILSTNQYVGIGSTQPTQILDVVGTIVASSKIGIGTTNPQTDLHLWTTQWTGTKNQLRIDANFNSGSIPVWVGRYPATGFFVIDNNGYVGIGSTQPVDTLDVAGNVLISGDCTIGGTLSKGAGSFQINHPLDPENKFLRHSFVESPEMRNVYYGQSKTVKGAVVITLPEWWMALNGTDKSEYTYQLTSIGRYHRLYISKEIENNQFEVSSLDGDCKFSWEVSAIRHDTYAEENRIIVEELK